MYRSLAAVVALGLSARGRSFIDSCCCFKRSQSREIVLFGRYHYRQLLTEIQRLPVIRYQFFGSIGPVLAYRNPLISQTTVNVSPNDYHRSIRNKTTHQFPDFHMYSVCSFLSTKSQEYIFVHELNLPKVIKWCVWSEESILKLKDINI